MRKTPTASFPLKDKEKQLPIYSRCDFRNFTKGVATEAK